MWNIFPRCSIHFLRKYTLWFRGRYVSTLFAIPYRHHIPPTTLFYRIYKSQNPLLPCARGQSSFDDIHPSLSADCDLYSTYDRQTSTLCHPPPPQWTTGTRNRLGTIPSRELLRADCIVSPVFSYPPYVVYAFWGPRRQTVDTQANASGELSFAIDSD